MQKKVLFAAGIVVLGIAATGWYLYNKPHQDTGSIAPSADLSAQALFTAYQADENAANARFLGKVIRISGRVSELSTSDSSGNLVLAASLNGGINCSFASDRAGKLKNIHTGDSVLCKGRCTGFLMDVNLSDCVIE